MPHARVRITFLLKLQGNTDLSRQGSNRTSSFDDDDEDDDAVEAGADADVDADPDAKEKDAEDSEKDHDDDDEDDGEPRVLTEEEIQKRNEAYGTIPRSQSELDLRAAAATPPPAQGRKNSLLSVQEEDDSDDGEAPTSTGQQQEQQQGQKDNSGKSKKFSAKKMSLADPGLAKSKYPTQFDDVDDEGDDDGDAPGAFKRPKSAFTLAKSDLKSKDWQSEIEGIN